MGKKRKWWLLLLPVILLAAVLTGIFWDEIVIRIAPKTVLTSALTKTFHSLEERFRDEPLRILAKNIDSDGKYTADVKMDTSYQLLGNSSYDMTVWVDLPAHQVLADGVIENGGKDLELSLYLDQDFMAVSSQELLQGDYYGINYESFASDIRSIPMLSFLIPEATLQEWEASILELREQMNRDCTLPKFPEITEDDLQKVMLGVLTFPCEVEREKVPVNGMTLDCYKLTYSASGAAVCEILGYIMDTQEAADGSVSASFFLCEKTLVKADFSGTAGENSVFYSLELGTDAAADPLSVQAARNENGKQTDVTVKVHTQRSEQDFLETWDISNGEKEISVAYRWTPIIGDLELRIDDMQEPILLNLSETENSFCISTEDFGQLLDALDPKDKERGAIACIMTVSKGSSIEVPSYNNLDQWSLEDFLKLLSGIGSLVGLGTK